MGATSTQHIANPSKNFVGQLAAQVKELLEASTPVCIPFHTMFTIDVAMITMEAKSMIIYISMIAMVTRVVTGRGEGVMGAVSSNVSGRNARMGGATYSTSRT